jgi:DNA-binding response OmpR family regulator
MADPARILIVQADWPPASLLAAALEDEGMVADVAGAGPQAIGQKRMFEPDVVVIGLGLSRRQDLTMVQTFAAEGDCGVIVVSIDDIDSAQDVSLEIGADDFIVEPVALRRIVARIRAVQRRMSRREATWRRLRVRVDSSKRGLIGPNGVMSTLTEAEFALLQTLIDAGGGPVSRERLGHAALRRTLADDDRSVDQLVLKLRRKLAQHGLAERAILSTRGLGYSVPEPEMFEVTPNRPPPRVPLPLAMALPELSDDPKRRADRFQP